MSEKGTVLVIDDEESLRLGCKRILSKSGYRVVLASTGEEGLSVARKGPNSISVVILDLMLPDTSGMEVLKGLKELDPELPVVVITGYATVDKAVEAMKAGAYDFIPKPFTPDQLRITVDRATERRRFQLEREYFQKEMERTLRDVVLEKSRVKAIVNSMMEGLAVTNAQGEIVLINPRAKLYLSLGDGDCIGKRFEDILPKDCEFLSVYREVSKIQDGSCSSVSGECKVGETFLKVDISPFRDEDTGEILGFVVVLNDITEFKNLDMMKSEFVSMVSHELRAPVGAISQQISVILKGYVGELNEKQRELLERIKERCNGLLELVRDLLDLAKIESGLFTEYRETINFPEVVKEEAELLQEEARKKDIVMNLSMDSSPLNVEADRRSIQMIVMNLLSNAIKYNRPGGRVDVVVERAGDFLKFQVADTGVGIPEEDIPRIFDRFYRVKTGETRKIVGSGLGLSIVKTLIEKLGGRIEVESKLGEGTRFTVVLPLKPPQPESRSF